MAVKTGTNKKEKINGSASDDTITGLAGSDTLSGAAGNDFLDGGVDNDSLNGENGDDTLIGGAGKDTLVGGSGDDSLDGGNDNDKLTGDAGSDTLNGGTGADVMTGGDGDDYYFVDNLKDSVNETNKVQTTGGNDTVESVLLNYTLPVNVENLVLAGIELSNGSGNKSNNVITGNLADNVLKGDEGNDSLVGNEGVDTLDGGLGMDTLEGGDDSDIYFMNNTEDTIVEYEGGGDLDQVNATVSFSLSENPNVEALELSGAKAIDGTGNEFDNLIQEKEGGTVANTLNGMAGNDTLDGAGGDDELNGGDGDDVLDGGDGNDTAIYNSLKSNYQIDTNVDAAGVPQIVVKYVGDAESAEGTDILSNIETIEFSDGTTINAAAVLDGTWDQNSTLEIVVDIIEPTPEPIEPAPKPTTSTGSANDKVVAPDTLSASKVQYGTKEADTIGLSSGKWINGLGGNDNISGYITDQKVYDDYGESVIKRFTYDTILGGAGDDSLIGNTGIDYLIGGSGVDHLRGGTGYYPVDFFIFGTGDSGIGIARDVIEDFKVKYDIIDLAGAKVAGSSGYGVPLTFIEAEPFTAINQVRYETDFDNIQTLVQINLDSDFSTVEAEIGLTGLMNLTAANFILTK